MSSAISGVLILMVAAAIVHFVSTEPFCQSRGCGTEEVYRWSIRACYTPQGE